MVKRPFFSIGLGAFVAALLCSYFTLELTAVLLCTLFVTVILALCFVKGTARVILKRMCVSALLAATLFLIKELAVVYPQLALDGQTATVTARIRHLSADGKSCTVAVENGDVEDGVKLLLFAGDEPIRAENGDLLQGDVCLAAAYDRTDLQEARYGRADGVYLVAWPISSLSVTDGKESLPKFDALLYALRDGIKETVHRFVSEERAGLCVSVLIGDKSGLSTEIEGNFRASGVYHLLAVSGIHLSVIVGALWWLLGLFGCRRGVKVAVCLMMVLLFSGVCGFTASVVRAAMMTAILLLSGLFRRASDGLNTLGFAAFVMLLVDPFCVFDIGWQLSFAATFGMFSWLPVWQREVTARAVRACPTIRVVTEPFLTAVGVSVSATAMTVPLSVLYFGEISTVFLLGNLGCVTATSVVLLGCFAAILFFGIPPVCGTIFRFCEVLCDWLCAFTEWLSSWDFALVITEHVFTVIWLFALVIVFSAAYVMFGMRGVKRVFMALLCVLFTAVTVFNVLFGATVTVTPLNMQNMVFLVTTADSTGVILSGGTDEAEAAQASLCAKGIDRLDWLVWLAPPSAECIDGAALTAEITLVSVAGETSQFVSYPSCEEIEQFDKYESVVFSSKGRFIRADKRYYLQFGDTVMALCPFGGGKESIPDGCENLSLVFTGKDVPEDINPSVPTIVCCERRFVDEVMSGLPYGSEAYFTALDTVTVIGTGSGDIRLRD